MTREELNELMDEFYGTYDEETDEYGDDGVYEDNYELAEWARNAVPDLFEAISKFLSEKE
jgi:hypothetical protein